MTATPRWIRALAPLALAGSLAGCISLGGEPPTQLLTLTPVAVAPVGAGASGRAEGALTVVEPTTSQALNVTRVPVRVSTSALSYLADAFWVEKPAQLFRTLLAETVRARTSRLVVSGGELDYAAQTQLSGQLVEMGYDVANGSVTVRYDALLALPGGEIRTRRFENTVANVLPDAAAVGPALNQAANAVAVEVADWVGAA